MKEWFQRTTEEANLLNPAFCSQLLASSIYEYFKEGNHRMPFLLLYLILPIVLYKPTRTILPHDTRTNFLTWIQENQIVKVNIHKHIISLKKHTQESLMFGLQYNIINFTDNGELQTSYLEQEVARIKRQITGETSECFKKALFIGKWFAKAGAPHFIFTLLGVKP